MRTLFAAVLTMLVAVPSWAAAPAAPPPPPPAAPAAETPVVVEATGAVDFSKGGLGVEGAKEKARDVALREAINKVVGTTITSSSEMADFTLVRDVVFSQTAGFIRKYDILDTKVDDQAETVTVKVRAEVLKGQVDKDAAAIATLLSYKKQKRVYVMITDVSTETVGGKASGQVATIRHGVFDAAFADKLRQDGFTVLDPNMVDGKLKNRAAVQALGTPQEAAELADAVGADLIFYGNAQAGKVEEAAGVVDGKNLIAADVRYAVSVTAPDAREQLASVTGTAMLSGYTLTDATNKAIGKAADQALKEMRTRIYETWRKHMTGPARIVMTVTGLKDWGMFKAFKTLLTSQVRGVKELTSDKFDKGTALIDVAMVGTVDNLASDLSGKTFKGLTINVNKVSGNTIELALGK